MTELLQQVLEEVASLPESEQDMLAGWLREEIRSENRWGQLLSSSQGTLKSLADEALDELRKGTTQPLDPETL